MTGVFKRGWVRYLVLSLLAAAFILSGAGCGASAPEAEPSGQTRQEGGDLSLIKEGEDQEQTGTPEEADVPDENGEYTSKDEVAAYLHAYGHLPSNYITKKEAKTLGWDSSRGNLAEACPGKSIGGDYFGNYEGILPGDVRYHECDIDSRNGKRGPKRIVYSDDGAIYYTEDHYETFEQLY